ncbi:MAG TPA: CapA family protein, partial [Thermomonospora sp.]|nr:CapA family protein [Thermomonospora sp.]
MRRKSAIGSALVGTALLATACGGGDGTPKAKGETVPPKRSAPNTSRPAPAKEPIILAFGGDTHFEGQLRARLANPRTALGPIASTLRAADFAMVNLETAITTAGTPAPAKQFVFRAPPSAFTALKAAGVDVTSMA